MDLVYQYGGGIAMMFGILIWLGLMSAVWSKSKERLQKDSNELSFFVSVCSRWILITSIFVMAAHQYSVYMATVKPNVFSPFFGHLKPGSYGSYVLWIAYALGVLAILGAMIHSTKASMEEDKKKEEQGGKAKSQNGALAFVKGLIMLASLLSFITILVLALYGTMTIAGPLSVILGAG